MVSICQSSKILSFSPPPSKHNAPCSVEVNCSRDPVRHIRCMCKCKHIWFYYTCVNIPQYGYFAVCQILQNSHILWKAWVSMPYTDCYTGTVCCINRKCLHPKQFNTLLSKKTDKVNAWKMHVFVTTVLQHSWWCSTPPQKEIHFQYICILNILPPAEYYNARQH